MKYKSNKDCKQHRKKIFIILFVILFSFIISLLAPIKKQEIKLTALDNDIAYLGNDTIFGISNRVESEGRWLHTNTWLNDKEGLFSLVYSPQSDLIKNQTREIVIEIDQQTENKLYFMTGPRYGKVEVSWDGQTQTIDCFSENEGMMEITLQNGWQFSIQEFLIKAIIFLIILFILGSAALLISRYALQIKAHAVRNKITYLFAFLAFGMLVFLVLHSQAQVLRVNEMYQIGYIRDGTPLEEVMSILGDLNVEMAPPLFTVLAYAWYRIVPYGVGWILLLPEILTAAAAFFIGIATKKAAGTRTGLLATVLYMTSTAIIVECGYEFRSYSLCLLTATIAFYFYIARYQNKGREKWKNVLCYGFAMALLAYSHYYGIIVCLFLFVTDVILYIKHKIKLRCVVSYLIAGGLFLPWFIVILQGIFNRVTGSGDWWMQKPDTGTLTRAVYFLSGEAELSAPSQPGLLYFFLIIGTAGSVFLFIKAIKDKKNSSNTADGIQMIAAAVYMGTLLFMFLITKYGPLAIFINRYFICLFPFTIYITARALTAFFDMFKDKTIHSLLLTVSCCVYLAISANYFVVNELNWKCDVTSPYRNAALTLQGWDNPYAEKYFYTSTCVVSSNPKFPTLGWEDFYLRERNKLDAPDVKSVYNSTDFTDILHYDQLFVLEDEYSYSSEFISFLNENYSIKKLSPQLLYCEKLI